MPLCKTEVIVLKSINYGETSKILTLYSRTSGKISVIAKGARNIKSRFGGTLEPINYLAIIFYEKESRNIQYLSQVDIIEYFPQIKKDLEKTAIALAVCELIDKLEVGHEGNPLLFRLNLSALRRLDTASRNPLHVFRGFQLHICDLMGFKPHFHRCMGCDLQIEGAVAFDLASGSVLCDKCSGGAVTHRKLTAEALNTLRAFQTVHLSMLSEMQVGESTQRQMDDFLRAYMQFHIEHLRDLKALRFLQQI